MASPFCPYAIIASSNAFSTGMLRVMTAASMPSAKNQVAPSFTPEALTAFASKPNIRVLETGSLQATGPGRRIQQVEGGVLVQDKDVATLDESELKIVTERKPTEQELAGHPAAHPDCPLTSARTGLGIAELRAALAVLAAPA